MILVISVNDIKNGERKVTKTKARTKASPVVQVKSIRADYRKPRLVGRIRPKPIDEAAHKATVQASTALDLRRVAKWMVATIPLEGEDWGKVVQETLDKLEALTKGKKGKAAFVALDKAYWFSQRVPMQERRDMFDSLYLTLMQKGLIDHGLAYAVARADWVDWWRAYKIRSHYSLDAAAECEGEDTDENGRPIPPYARYLVGVCDFEVQMIGKVDGERLLSQLPSHIRRIVQSGLDGNPIRHPQRVMLNKWIAQRPTILAQYMSK